MKRIDKKQYKGALWKLKNKNWIEIEETLISNLDHEIMELLK